MLRAGVDLLLEEGLATGAERVTLDRAAIHAGVSRASAYRLWGGGSVKPQTRFSLDLIVQFAEYLPVGGDDDAKRTEEAIVAAVSELPDLRKASPEERWIALANVVRAGAWVNLTSIAASPSWWAYVGIAAATRSRELSAAGREADASVHEALERGEARALQGFSDTYEALAELFGLEPRAPYEVGQFATAAAALVEGLALRMRFNPLVAAGPSPYDESPWDLFTIGFIALVREFFAPVMVTPDVS